MNEITFYNLFVPTISQANYLTVEGLKMRIDSFVSMNLNYPACKVQYVAETAIPDAILGRWFREKKIQCYSASSYSSTVKYDLKLEMDKVLLELAKISSQISCKPDVSLSNNGLDKLRVKIKIEKAVVIEIMDKYKDFVPNAPSVIVDDNRFHMMDVEKD